MIKKDRFVELTFEKVMFEVIESNSIFFNTLRNRSVVMDTVSFIHHEVVPYDAAPFDLVACIESYMPQAIVALAPEGKEEVREVINKCGVISEWIFEEIPPLDTEGLLPIGATIWLINYDGGTQYPVKIIGYEMVFPLGKTCYQINSGGKIKAIDPHSLEYQRTTPYSEEELAEAIRWYGSPVHERIARFFRETKQDELFHHRMGHHWY